MSKALRWLLVLSVLCIGGALFIAAWHQFSKPTTLRVAVGPVSVDDSELMAAWSRALARDKGPVRLSLVSTSGPWKRSTS